MAPPRKRLTVPASLAVALLVTGCTSHPPTTEDAAVADVPPISDACTVTGCLSGPITICSPDDAGVLSCERGNCTAAYALDGGYLGQQCYGECVTSTVADGATRTGFC